MSKDDYLKKREVIKEQEQKEIKEKEDKYKAELKYWKEKQINEQYLKRPEETKEQAKERLKKIKSNQSKPKPQKLFNREEAEAAAREYHKKKGQFKEITDKEDGDYIRGERGGLYEIRISSRTGKPYRHYW